jgi:hypothetical protein
VLVAINQCVSFVTVSVLSVDREQGGPEEEATSDANGHVAAIAAVVGCDLRSGSIGVCNNLGFERSTFLALIASKGNRWETGFPPSAS